VVDADPYSRLVTKATLVEAGFRVAMAGSVSRALQSLLSGVHASVDVVLLVSTVLHVILLLVLLYYSCLLLVTGACAAECALELHINVQALQQCLSILPAVTDT
jgi:hypothetical protein